MERTLILLKPDTVLRGIVGEIVSRFEKAGLKMVAVKMIAPSKEHYHEHYETIGTMISRHGQEIFENTLKFMSSGPVIAIVLEGVEAVGTVRKMVGATEPKSSAPGTIRGDYAHMSYGQADKQQVGIPNIIHSSGDKKEAEMEINLWFSADEIHDYRALHEPVTTIRSDSEE
jgi:nucleoside-diphosphate kinase